MNVIGIAASGLTAATLRLSASAANVANVDSTAPAGDGSDAQVPYTPLQVVQTSLASGGVRAEMRRAPTAGLRAYPPAPVFADPGIFAETGVDLVTEAIEQISAMNAFKANLATIRAAEQMMQSVFDTTV